MNQDLVINETNFSEYFRDCRLHAPEHGDIMAKYTSMAELIAGSMKKDLIDLLQKDKVIPATQLFRKIGCCSEQESIRVCKAICEDLVSGMTTEDVENKIGRAHV